MKFISKLFRKSLRRKTITIKESIVIRIYVTVGQEDDRPAPPPPSEIIVEPISDNITMHMWG